MKTFRSVLLILVVLFLLTSMSEVSAQCAMCTLNAENSVQNGSTEGKGLNNGILYLLAAPYLAAACVGVLWYKKYRRKNIAVNMKNSKINLN